MAAHQLDLPLVQVRAPGRGCGRGSPSSIARTFCSATESTQASLCESVQCAASIAGWILSSSPVRLPSFTPSSAPFTAPQRVWPSTTMQLRADLGGVLEAAQLVVVHDVARDPHSEYVADPLVEDDLDRRARVHAGEHRGERVLARRGRDHLRGVVVRLALVRGEARVARLQALERLAPASSRLVTRRSAARARSPRARVRPWPVRAVIVFMERILPRLCYAARHAARR